MHGMDATYRGYVISCNTIRKENVYSINNNDHASRKNVRIVLEAFLISYTQYGVMNTTFVTQSMCAFLQCMCEMNT